ncbi:hypothetical protein EDD86DRAFT_269212, partial [Gorgonomyces haynaldii]
MKSMYDVVLHGKSVGGINPFLGGRVVKEKTAGPYLWDTYEEVVDRINCIGSGLIYHDLKKGDCLGIFAKNRKEWYILQQAAYLHGIIVVPLFDTLGWDALESIIKQTKIKIICTTSEKVVGILENSVLFPTLEKIVVMDVVSENLSKISSGYPSLSLVEFGNLETDGMTDPIPRPEDVNRETIACINYTSGTNGSPKGVILTHGNLMASCSSYVTMALLTSGKKLDQNDTHFSYLPMSHVYEQVVQSFMTYFGCKIAFYQGDLKRLMDDIAAAQPTYFCGVPRVFVKIHDTIMESIRSKKWLIRCIFQQAILAKRGYVKKGYQNHALWDHLIFNKIREKFGGKITTFVSGAAPMSPRLIHFFRICFSAIFLEGYGQTETGAVLSLTGAYDLSVGTTGPPSPFILVKLVDVPELKYTSKDKPFPRGEICVKGPNVFKEYYNASSESAFLPDGWLKTGDVGAFDKQGRLKILDRVRNVFKLSQGEFLCPEKVETTIASQFLVSQVMVTGSGLHPRPVAIIVPDWEQLQIWGPTKGYKHQRLEEYCKDSKFEKQLLGMLNAHCREAELAPFEIPAAIKLLTEPFSIENGCLTPTLKIKRFEIAKKHHSLI